MTARMAANASRHRRSSDGPHSATRASVSVSLIRAVEQGRAPASPAFVSAVARALGIGVAELLNQPFARANQGERKLHSVVPALRREMAAYLLHRTRKYPGAASTRWLVRWQKQPSFDTKLIWPGWERHCRAC